MTSFSAMTLQHWRQFETVTLDLSSPLCVLTGPNGCGKTTILNILGRHFGWSHQLISSSSLSRRLRRLTYWDSWDAREQDTEQQAKIGTITYANGVVSELFAPSSLQPQYQLAYSNQQEVTGIHVPSHRPPPAYARINSIPIDPKTSQQHYQAYQQYLFQTYGEHSARNPAIAMKEALIAFAVFGEGNSSVAGNAEYSDLLKGFEEVLRKLLPLNIEFEKLEVRTPDVILKTKSGDFPLESMSGGLNALFAIAWQIHTFGFSQETCTILIDEPENHLHPSMQREFLPRLSEAFPRYKFIVATHSPFVVASKPDAFVYALKYNESQRVVTERLAEADLSGSPNIVLRDVLDVPVTMPIWVTRRIGETLSKYEGAPVTQHLIASLRAELEAQGLGQALSDFLAQGAEGEPKA